MQNRLEKIIEKENFTTFFSHLFTLLGAIFLASGVMFFIAYNWEVLGKFFKFGIVEFAILGSFVLAYFLKEESFGFKSAIVVGSFLIGVLLALFGQVYQTGAEPYELFATWALLVLPIALLVRFAGIWLFEVILINFATYLYSHNFIATYDLRGYMLFIINASILIIWSFLASYLEFLKKKYAIRFIASVAILWTTFDVIIYIGDNHHYKFVIYPLILFIVYLFYRYRVKEIDIYILSNLLLSLHFIVLALILRQNFRDPITIFILMAIFLLPSGFLSISWLKNLTGDKYEK